MEKVFFDSLYDEVKGARNPLMPFCPSFSSKSLGNLSQNWRLIVKIFNYSNNLAKKIMKNKKLKSF
jgi:hypothetical protein